MMVNALTSNAVKAHTPVHKINQTYAAQPHLIDPQIFATDQAVTYRDLIKK
jgi:hypothetical protein